MCKQSDAVFQSETFKQVSTKHIDRGISRCIKSASTTVMLKTKTF